MSVGVEKDLGLDLDDPLGLELAYVIQGYHEGDYKQFIGLFLPHKGCEQKYSYSLGRFEAKETYEILAGTIVPRNDAGIGMLNKLYCLIMKSPEGFDNALVDRSACGDVIN